MGFKLYKFPRTNSGIDKFIENTSDLYIWQVFIKIIA